MQAERPGDGLLSWAGSARSLPRSIGLLAALPIVRFLAVDASQGLDHLLYWFLSDDAFYTFEISRHIPEFNEGIPTSGFHPLYVILISPFHRLLPPEWAVSASLLLLVTCISLGTIWLYRLVDGLWGHGVALWCAAAWSTNGTLYGVALIGLEVMLAATLVLLFFTAFGRLDARADEPPSPLAFLGLGALAGLVFWGRMDAPLIVAPAVAFVALRLLGRRQYRALAALTLPAVLIPLLWLAYLYLATGSPLPDSSSALRNLRGLDGSWLDSGPGIESSIKRLAWGFAGASRSSPERAAASDGRLQMHSRRAAWSWQ